MPGVSMTTTRFPLTLASITLISLVHEWRPVPTFCFSDEIWLMNCLEWLEVNCNECKADP